MFLSAYLLTLLHGSQLARFLVFCKQPPLGLPSAPAAEPARRPQQGPSSPAVPWRPPAPSSTSTADVAFQFRQVFLSCNALLGQHLQEHLKSAGQRAWNDLPGKCSEETCKAGASQRFPISPCLLHPAGKMSLTHSRASMSPRALFRREGSLLSQGLLWWFWKSLYHRRCLAGTRHLLRTGFKD